MTVSATDPVHELTIDPDSSQFRHASTWLGHKGRELGIPAAEIARLETCLNEVLANILEHGGASARSTPIGLRLARSCNPGDAAASLTVTDSGSAFDPLAVEPGPRPRALAEARPGGLGLMMTRSRADSLSYRYSEGRNQLTVGVRWSRVQ
jgi:anti-sigma regulatory factor (Ser/Thr protein kinase)